MAGGDGRAREGDEGCGVGHRHPRVRRDLALATRRVGLFSMFETHTVLQVFVVGLQASRNEQVDRCISRIFDNYLI